MVTGGDREGLLAQLAGLPDFLALRLGALSPDRARLAGRADTFSPVEQCWHLADLEREGYAVRIERLLREDDPVLPDFDGARVAKERQYAGRHLVEGLRAFAEARRANVAVLRSLEAGQWSRRGSQEGVGEISLDDVARMMAEHDAGHRVEIEAWLRDREMLSEVVAVLSRSPAALGALLDGLPEALLTCREGEDTFSPMDVLGHLIHGEETDWVPRIRLILTSGEARPFAPFDRLGFREKIRGRSVGELLDEFRSRRSSNLAFLEGLAPSPAQLARRGRHPELGAVTLGELLATWAAHDLDHIGQVVRVVSRRYSEAVGPWKPYLDILNR